jgi:hypothetical protein
LTPALGLSGLHGCCEETAIGRSDRPVLAAYYVHLSHQPDNTGNAAAAASPATALTAYLAEVPFPALEPLVPRFYLTAFLGYNHSLSALSLPTARPPTSHSYFRAPSPENKILDAMKISMGQSAGQSIITIIKKSKNCASLVWLLESANKKSKNKI